LSFKNIFPFDERKNESFQLFDYAALEAEKCIIILRLALTSAGAKLTRKCTI